MARIPHLRFLVFLGVLLLATAALALRAEIEQAIVFGFDIAVLVFLAASLPLLFEAGPEAIRSRAARDDGGRVLLLLTAIASLMAVLTALVRLVQAQTRLGWAELGPVIGTLALAWVFVNTVYSFHYAHLYYDQSGGADVGGLDFPGKGPPVFADFCYFAFTIGMTCQTSDVVIATTAFRRSVTGQGLLSYVFNLGVLAMVINLMAGIL